MKCQKSSLRSEILRRKRGYNYVQVTLSLVDTSVNITQLTIAGLGILFHADIVLGYNYLRRRNRRIIL